MMRPLLNLYLLVLFFKATYAGSLLPYGTADGDSQCQKTTDYECMNVNMGFIFKIGDTFAFSSLSVLSNGCLAYDASESSTFTASVFSAAYNYALGGSVFYRSTSDQSVLDLIDSQLAENYFKSKLEFSSSKAFIATWVSVVEDGTSNRNTFQAVLVTGSNSNAQFMIFNYGKCESDAAKCEFNLNSTHFESLNGKCGPYESNVANPGQFIFLVSGGNSTSRSQSSHVITFTPETTSTKSESAFFQDLTTKIPYFYNEINVVLQKCSTLNDKPKL
jgi:hypothetical protein